MINESKRISRNRLLENCAALSLFLSAATAIVWGIAAACIEMRLDFSAGQGRYVEIATFVGAVQLIVTRSYETPPSMIKRFQRANPNARGWFESEYVRDHLPPHGVHFSSRWLDLEDHYPSMFSWFGFDRVSWPGLFACTIVEVPYWFLALLFAILPVIWRVRRKSKAPISLPNQGAAVPGPALTD